jgi:SnoaL-like domain
MDIIEKLQIVREIEELMVDFWHEVDLNWGANAHNYFTEDCSYTTSMNTRKGRDAIERFYDTRQARGDRVSRHLVSNHKITIQDRNHASAVWVLSLFAADGKPILPSKAAIMMADVRDELVRGDDQRWLYRSRVVTPLFRDDTPTTG